MKNSLRHVTGLGLVVLVLVVMAPGYVLEQAAIKIGFHTVLPAPDLSAGGVPEDAAAHP
jgi:hypothetical protein